MDNGYIDFTDQDLAALASEGDLGAMEVLYRRHYALMVNFGLKYGSDLEAVQDCIQTLFVGLICRPRLWAQIHISVRSWLLSSLRNALYHHRAVRARDVSIDDIFGYEFGTANAVHADDGPNDEQYLRRQRLRQAFRSLSGRQRMAIYLYYSKNLSHKEIGELLRINPQSSMNLLNRAMEKLRSLLCLLTFIIYDETYNTLYTVFASHLR